MRIMKTVEDSLELMEQRIASGEYSSHTMRATGESGTIHLHSMRDRMAASVGKGAEGTMDVEKLATWRGYIQGCVVAHGLANVDEFAAINRQYRDEDP